MFLICPTCNNQFKIKPSHAYRRRFCSRLCKRLTPGHKKRLSQLKSKGKVIKECLNCKKTYGIYPSTEKIRGSKFCTRNCWRIANNIKEGASCIEKICLICKKNFITQLNVLRKGEGKFCSKACCGIYIRGRLPWNKGLTKDDPRIAAYALKIAGENAPNWKGGITPENKKQRKLFKQTIQKEVFERDNYTCQLCGQRGGTLQVDHIQSWAEYVELRFNMENCRTLCMSCHYFVTFGKPMPKNIKTFGHNLLKGDK